ncbi:hypothetical protein BDZ89DRAFT_1016644 [Hymenopellis radicata]|nr:hypothetical protein BDZ89DRAFT_1016644 [Hymenopellis radicata]
MTWREPYHGTRRKLVLAFDLGTTFSGVSFSVLDPGLVPKIQGVTKFPAQEHFGGDAKIPTIVYYDHRGTARAFGAEALMPSIVEAAEEKGWTKYEEFKLHLSSASQRNNTTSLPPLPPGIDIVTLFADFYAYLFECAKTFIQDSRHDGISFWNSISNDIEFVLSHPNGWEGIQQTRMRQAAAMAGLVPGDIEGYKRIHLVTEGEASLHFCIQQGLASRIRENEGVIVVDAGGGTVDISTYTGVPSTRADSMAFEEIASPQCNFVGSVFVTRRAKEFFKVLLAGSRFIDDVDYIAECFDKTTKLLVRNDTEAAYIKFGKMRDRDAALDIRNGSLKISGSRATSFFEPSISSIIQVIDQQRFSATKTVSTVFLVGGFAASDWLHSRLKRHLSPLGLSFCRPDSHVNKAVADGAISFYLDHVVAARISRYNYGVDMYNVYNDQKTEHVRRKHKTFVDESGVLCLGDQYEVILPKNTKVYEDKEFRASFWHHRKSLDRLSDVTLDILYYTGTRKNPRWRDEESDDVYPALCTVTANTREAAKGLQMKRRRDNNEPYFTLNYDIILIFGRTELKAQVAWKEHGVEKRGPAWIVYEQNL